MYLLVPFFFSIFSFTISISLKWFNMFVSDHYLSLSCRLFLGYYGILYT